MPPERGEVRLIDVDLSLILIASRYINMDYIFSQTLQHSRGLKTFIISYDIACQWSVNLVKRMSSLDPSCQVLDPSVSFRFLVPKFHLPAHIESCRTSFSFNYTPGVGRTDGEAPERGWGMANALAPSTREMGPGSRRDVLDYHAGDVNWTKFVGMGMCMFL